MRLGYGISMSIIATRNRWPSSFNYLGPFHYLHKICNFSSLFLLLFVFVSRRILHSMCSTNSEVYSNHLFNCIFYLWHRLWCVRSIVSLRSRWRFSRASYAFECRILISLPSPFSGRILCRVHLLSLRSLSFRFCKKKDCWNATNASVFVGRDSLL